MYSRLAILRLVLALCVVLTHSRFSAFQMAGGMAVVCFFFISGFLVAGLLRETYADRPGAFLSNRFLRIFPIYWACLVFALPIVGQLPFDSYEIGRLMGWPETSWQWLFNLVLIGEGWAMPRVIGTSWSLGMELGFYALLFFFYTLFQRWRILLLCLLFLASFTPLAAVSAVLHFGYALALGALCFEVKLALPRAVAVVCALLLAAAMLVAPAAMDHQRYAPESTVYMILAPLLLFGAFSLFTEVRSDSRLAALCGSISYPLFLLHMPIAVLLTWLGMPEQGPVSFLLTSLCSLVASYLVVLAVERPLVPLRRALRERRSSARNGLSRAT